MLNLNMVNTCIANSFVESFLYIGCGHRSEQLPSDDVSERYLTINQEMREQLHGIVQRVCQFYDTQGVTPELRLHYDSAQLMSNQGGSK